MQQKKKRVKGKLGKDMKNESKEMSSFLRGRTLR